MLCGSAAQPDLGRDGIDPLRVVPTLAVAPRPRVEGAPEPPERPRALNLGALRNDATKVEIREALLQVVMHAGVPAAVDAFRIETSAFGARNDWT